MSKVSVIFGTRPEAIKLCPLVLALNKTDSLCPHVCVTGQHREMLWQVLEGFAVVPNVDLDLMEQNQGLSRLAARVLESVDKYLEDESPDLVIVQGDTTSALAASLAAFHRRILVGHVEAGLRTWKRWTPFPEEMNRVLTTRLSEWHFAPTETARQNLLREQIADQQIVVTGNTVIDALLLTVDRVRKDPPRISGLPASLQPAAGPHGPRVVLVTGHRRENFGVGIENICHALRLLSKEFRDVHFVFPVHLNPNVRGPVERILRANTPETPSHNIHLIEPLDYFPFVAMMDRATLLLTDSGGVQEEAPSLGKPVLVMRDSTERPEAIEAGTARLVGTDVKKICSSVAELLCDQQAYAAMANAVNPFGDGRACGRIVDSILKAGIGR
jgi:UDP-N-acetylglucosamine 2-epimerase (non-hydrolysing)